VKKTLPLSFIVLATLFLSSAFLWADAENFNIHWSLVPGCSMVTSSFFKFRTAELNVDAMESPYWLTESWLKGAGEYPIEIAVHLHSEVTAEENLKLSERQSEVLKDYLVLELGLDKEKLIIKSYGDKEPLESEDAQNTRVEITVLPLE